MVRMMAPALHAALFQVSLFFPTLKELVQTRLLLVSSRKDISRPYSLGIVMTTACIRFASPVFASLYLCLLYTSDAADE